MGGGFIAIVLLGLYAVMAAASNLPAVIWGNGGGFACDYALLIGYPLFIFNALLAFKYYQALPRALGRFLIGGFFQAGDRRIALRRAKVVIRGMKTRVKYKNAVIYAGSALLIGVFHWLYSRDGVLTWVDGQGGGLSAAGWLHAIYLTLIVSMAFQFIWCVAGVFIVLYEIRCLVLRGQVRVVPWRLALHPSIEPLVDLFWTSLATLGSLYIFNFIQVFVSMGPRGGFSASAEMWVFSPWIYGIATPLMILGHLWPIWSMINFEKNRMMVHLAAVDAKLMPTSFQKLSEMRAPSDLKLAVDESEINGKVLEQVKQIPATPLSFKKLVLLTMPLVAEQAIKHLPSLLNQGPGP
jgi:hypothetical protein